jgi:hypothetical protein
VPRKIDGFYFFHLNFKYIVGIKANFMKLAELKIAIIGLGYVGLPLAVEFGKKVQLLDLILIIVVLMS